jgi:hypothetical protein
MTLPNFFIIGAAKSGTSSLYMYLKQHPEIYMSPIKEPHFFSFDDQSKYTKGPGDPIYKAITDFDAYQALFDGVRDENAIGEASTSYLYRPEAPRRIYNLLPDAKFIVILRNPVDRAFSAYMHVVRDRRETAQNFKAALALEEVRKAAGWEPIWHFTSVGYYHEQLSRYYSLFDREQISVFLFEELISNQENMLKKIFCFLNVDQDFKPESSIKFNVSGKQKSKLFYQITNWLFIKPNPIRWLSRKIIPDANWVRQQNLERPIMPTMVRQELVEIFREDILKLEDLIERDLSHWLEQ